MKTLNTILIPTSEDTIPGVVILCETYHTDSAFVYHYTYSLNLVNNYCGYYINGSRKQLIRTYIESAQDDRINAYAEFNNGGILFQPTRDFIKAAAEYAATYEYYYDAPFTCARPKNALITYNAMARDKRDIIISLYYELIAQLCGDIATIVITRAIEAIRCDSSWYTVV